MYIAIDVGGTTVRVGLFATTDPSSEVRREVFSVANHYQADLAAIAKVITAFNQPKVKGIAMSLAGSAKDGVVTAAPNLSDWLGQPLDDDAAKAFGQTVSVINDGEAGGLWAANQHPESRVWYVTWGTGIGGSYVARQQAEPSEPGHQIIVPDGPPCTCGQRGCLEVFCAGWGIKKRFKKEPSALSEKEWDDVLEHFAQGVVNMLVIRPAEYVVFGGGITTRQQSRIPQLEKKLSGTLKRQPMPEVSALAGADDASLFGALISSES